MHLEEAKKYYAIVDKIRILFSVLTDVVSLLLAPASGGQHVNINPIPQLPTSVLFCAHSFFLSHFSHNSRHNQNFERNSQKKPQDKNRVATV